jgi:hypothetical protein
VNHPRVFFVTVLILLVALLAACGGESDAEPTSEMSDMAMDSPDDLDTSTEKMSEASAFMVAISSNMDPLDLNEIHSWTIHVETPDGAAVEGAEIAVDGGMPEHNHGFPTMPEVTEELGDGDYLLEGVKFSMAGWWELKLAITAGDQSDDITFNLVLE